MNDQDIIAQIAAIKPPTFNSQDTLDNLVAEYAIANTIYKVGERRRTLALDKLKLEYRQAVDEVQTFATSNMLKSSKELMGKFHTLVISANAPAQRIDGEAFRNELIKAGVNREVVDKCFHKAVKTSVPATSFTVVKVDND